MFLLGGAVSLERELQAILGAKSVVSPLVSSGEAVQRFEPDEEAVLVIAGDSALDRKRWGQHARAVVCDGNVLACAQRVQRIQQLILGVGGPSVERLLHSVTGELGASLGEHCDIQACPFPKVLREREIALLSIAGPSEGGVVVAPEGELANRLGTSARSDRMWDREIAATSTLLGLAEQVRLASCAFLAHFGAFELATPVVISGEGLSLRAGDCPQFAYRMDLSSASAEPVSAALVIAGWLGTGHGKPTTTAERLAGLDELRQELMTRRGVG